MEEHINLNNSEWCIMEVLWEEQPRTLMQMVHELKERQGWSKSTTGTMLRRMHEKGLVSYREGEKVRLYYTELERGRVAFDETKSFLKRTYGGKIGLLVSNFADNNGLTRKDIEELTEILHRAERGKQK